jgi:hypothetical protein
MTTWNKNDSGSLARQCTGLLGATLAQKVAQAAFDVKHVVISAS